MIYHEEQGSVPETLQDLVSPEILPAGELLRYPNQEDIGTSFIEPISRWPLEWHYFPDNFRSATELMIVAPLPHWSKNALGQKSKPHRIVVFGDGGAVRMAEDEFLTNFGGLLEDGKPQTPE